MSPGRLFIGNFDFEERLSGARSSRSEAARRRNDELSMAWMAAAEPGDAILVNSRSVGAFPQIVTTPRGDEVMLASEDDLKKFGRWIEVPWGWDGEVRRFVSRLGPIYKKLPPVELVARVNSRAFSYRCEADFKCGVDGQVMCTSVEEVRRAVSALPRWLIKANLAAAGRERLQGHGPTLESQAQSWIENRLTRDKVIFVEPFVVRVDEVGVQWDIHSPNWHPSILGIAPLQVDDRGQYIGSRFDENDVLVNEWNEAIEVQRGVVTRIRDLGYTGPVGIDAMKYRDAHGQVRIRPLQDINARWTMGRIALGWRDQLAPGEKGLMRIGTLAEFDATPVAGTKVLVSPRTLGGRPVHHATWIEKTSEPADGPKLLWRNHSFSGQ